MKKTIDVQIGEVKVERGQAILRSAAIGSCIAIAAYDAGRKIGGLAHAMLPGRAPAGKEAAEKTRYAADAIDAMLSEMARLGSKMEDVEVAVVGGANILRRPDDTVCGSNIESVLELLEKKHLKVKAQALGGTERRSISLDVERGIVSHSEGNGGEVEL